MFGTNYEMSHVPLEAGGSVMHDPRLQEQVKDFWDRSSCGEVYALGSSDQAKYETQGRARYELEPYLEKFAKFHEGRDKDVLEIGIGMGADHVKWARARPHSLTGIDLTSRALGHVKKRFDACGLESTLVLGDAESLPFPDDSFDIVYSWGVLHHTPDTPKAVREIQRVLRPDGVARVMIYHRYSLVGYMLWLRYALLKGRPFQGLNDIYHQYLESPGTKAYSVVEACRLFSAFAKSRVQVQLAFADLLEGAVGQRHRGVVLLMLKRLWPRFVLKRLFRKHGLYLLIEATK
jgi:SAM-dependent methyltransferase